MSGINSDIQASHQLISILEKSKSLTEDFIDELPGVFAIVEAEGRILRGNQKLADLMGSDLGSLLDQPISALFSQTHWAIFHSHCQAVIQRTQPHAEFELRAEAPKGSKENGSTPTFAWRIQPFELKDKKGDSPLLSIVAHDLTELKDRERELSEFFGSVPIGILTLREGGQIDPRYSAYTEVLIGRGPLAHKNWMDTLIQPASSSLSKEGVETFKTLTQLIGQSEADFELIWEVLPRELKLTGSGTVDPPSERYLGLTFQKIIEHGKVKKLLVLIEDQTARVLQQQKETEERARIESNSIRISQIRSCSPDILEIGMTEGAPLVEQLLRASKDHDASAVLNRLHSLKGAGRIMNFESLRGMTHQLEIEMKEALRSATPLPWEIFAAKIQGIEEEWNELTALYEALILRKKTDRRSTSETERPLDPVETKILFEKLASTLLLPESIHRYTQSERLRLSIQALSRKPLGPLENSLRLKAKETAQQLSKEIDLEYKIDPIWVDEDVYQLLSECLHHLMTNSLSHGIESPESREAKGKSRNGKISLSLSHSEGRIRGSFRDDGTGLDLERIRLSALRNGFLTLEDSGKCSPSDLAQLIFVRNLSTAEKLTEISGQGIGLDIVRTNLKKMQGDIRVSSVKDQGIQFDFEFLPMTQDSWNKRCIFLEGLAEKLQKDCLQLLQREGFADRLTWSPSQLEPGVLIADLERLILGVSSILVSEICALRPNGIDASLRVQGDQVLLHLKTQEDPAHRDLKNRIPPEFLLTLPWALFSIERAGGKLDSTSPLFSWVSEAGAWTAVVPLGRIYRPQNLPTIQVKVNPTGSPESQSHQLDQLRNFLNRIGVRSEIRSTPSNSSDFWSDSLLDLSHDTLIHHEKWNAESLEAEHLRNILSQKIQQLLGLS